MDYYIRQKTKKEFAQHIRGILRQRLGIVHQIYNYVFEQFGETKNFEKSDDETLKALMKNHNWANKINNSEIQYKDIVQKTLHELRQIVAEILSYRSFLEKEQIIHLEEIVNLTYLGIKVARNCNTDSETMKNSLINGTILSNWQELYDRDTFIDEVFVPSYKKLLKLEKSFKD